LGNYAKSFPKNWFEQILILLAGYDREVTQQKISAKSSQNFTGCLCQEGLEHRRICLLPNILRCLVSDPG